MSPAALRVGILIIELTVFFIVTAFATYFMSHAGALDFAPGEAPPAQFPVIAYDGDRARPEPKNYVVVAWSEWDGLEKKRPGTSLLLPEPAAAVRVGDAGDARFKVTDETESSQAIELTWRTAGGEQQVRYVARAGAIEPRYYRAVTGNTLLLGAAMGFVAGLLIGRAMRRRWLAQPGTFAPPSSS